MKLGRLEIYRAYDGFTVYPQVEWLYQMFGTKRYIVVWLWNYCIWWRTK